MPLQRGSFFQRLFKQHPADNAVIELNNLLAGTEISRINGQHIQKIAENYSLNLQQEYPLNLQEFFAVLWNWYLKSDGDPGLLADAQRLGALLQLEPSVISDLQNRIGENYYRRATKGAVSKRRLLASDASGLDKLANRLQITSDVTTRVLTEEKKLVVNQYIQPLISKNRCSPEEYREMERMIDNFQLEKQHKNELFKQFQALLSYWQAEHEPLQTILVDGGAIQKSEICYFLAKKVKWFESRNGSYGTKQLELINQGTLYLTGTRLVFVGNTKNSIIALNRIWKVSATRQQITIMKDKGKDPVIQLNTDPQILCILIERIRNGQIG